MNFIKYQIAATNENADLIAAITKLMLEAGQVDTPVTDAEAAPAKEASKPTLADLKAAIKAARAAHGEEFCELILAACGAKNSTLGRMPSTISEYAYASTIAHLNAGPQKETETKTTKTAPTKEAAKVEEAEEPAEDKAEEVTSGAALTDLKDAIKAARAAHGEAFCKAVLIANGATDSTLGRMASAINEDDYADTIDQLIAGPTEATADEPEDDGLDDEEDDGLDDEADDSEVTVDAVKLAAKAYAKEVGRVEAKDIMNANGASALSKIDECSPAQLKAMFKAFTA